eukprot:947943-Pleurochrysis_carterae.AAC.1
MYLITLLQLEKFPIPSAMKILDPRDMSSYELFVSLGRNPPSRSSRSCPRDRSSTILPWFLISSKSPILPAPRLATEPRSVDSIMIHVGPTC